MGQPSVELCFKD